MKEQQSPDAIRRVRDAASRGDWEEAYAGLVEMDAQGALAAADLPFFAEVAYAAGRLDEAIAGWERLHAACLQAADPVGAAGAAARVAMHLLFDTALMAPVRGWLTRAERLLQGRPDSAAHAWSAVVRSYERLLAGDLDGARPWAQRAIEAGDGLDRGAAALGRVADARLRILGGDVERGLALLDEVGAAAVSGDLDPLSTGVVYCELVCALQGLAQYDRAEQWTQAMERWCRTNAIGSLHGRCRVHRAEILRLRGSCDEAEAEAAAACEELRPFLRRELGWPLSELGGIRLRRGDLTGARQALLAAHHAGWDAQPGLALLRLAEGDAHGAAASVREALESPIPVPSKERPPNSSLQRAPLLEAQVEIEIAVQALDRARAAAAELETIATRYQSRALAASAQLARGRLSLAEGDATAARRQFAAAVRMWHEVGAPYEAAIARLGLAEAHRAAGDAAQAALEHEAARECLDRIRNPLARPHRGGTTAAPDTASANVLRRDGEDWVVEFSGRRVRVRDRKGMHYLARLLAEPGREFHVLDLAAAAGAGGRGAAAALDDAGAMLDDRARDAYRRRLTEIEDDIAEARALGDDARAAQAGAERDFLARELSRAFGLGGRARRAGSASERARASVTRALRQTMAKLAEHHPPLAAHLDRAIQTGTYCAYLPDPRVPISWTI